MNIKKLLVIVALWLPLSTSAQTADSSKAFYHAAKQELEHMLSGKTPLSYEQAIYQTENAWYDGRVDPASFKDVIDVHVGNIIRLAALNMDSAKIHPVSDLTGTAEQKKHRYVSALINYGIYSYMTSPSIFADESGFLFHDRYHYSTSDPMGTTDWTNTQVVNLLNAGKGNCFALASLYKIFAERLRVEALLCTAPSHVYIRHADDKGTYYNVELSSKAFPGTGTIETLTYTTSEAAKNNISLRELDKKQSVALCLVYLAKGYEHKYNIADDDFVLGCAETALQYDDHCLNAMLLKAKVLESRLVKQSKNVQLLEMQPEFQQYQKWIMQLCNLGYREMPFEMKNILVKGWTRDTLIQLKTTNHTPKSTANNNMQPTPYASLSWGLFDEQIQTKRLERFGNTVYDTREHKIVAFLPDDVLYNEYTFDPVVFAWNIDPLYKKYPSMSPYSAFGNSPILIRDADGRELFVGGKTDLSLRNLQSLVPEKYKSQIQIVDNRVVFNGFNDLPAEVKNYQGVTLLNNLITSERKYQYSVADKGTSVRRSTGEPYSNPMGLRDKNKNLLSSYSAQYSVLNLSITPRSGLEESDPAGWLPQNGFDGSVFVQDGDYSRKNSITGTGDFPIKRNTMVFHELYENYLRTEGGENGSGMDYGDENNRGGAHEESANAGNGFSRQVNGKADASPGVGDRFTPSSTVK